MADRVRSKLIVIRGAARRPSRAITEAPSVADATTVISYPSLEATKVVPAAIGYRRSLAAAVRAHVTFAPGVVDALLWAKFDDDLYEIGDLGRRGLGVAEFFEGNIRSRTAVPSTSSERPPLLGFDNPGCSTGQVTTIDREMDLV